MGPGFRRDEVWVTSYLGDILQVDFQPTSVIDRVRYADPVVVAGGPGTWVLFRSPPVHEADGLQGLLTLEVASLALTLNQHGVIEHMLPLVS